MTNEKIPVPKDRWKDEVNTNFFCCFRTRSWVGKRINGYRVVKKSFDEKGQLFVLKLKGHELVVTLTKDLIKSLHVKKDDTYGFMDLENEMVNGCRVVNKSYVEMDQVSFSTLTVKLSLSPCQRILSGLSIL